MTQPHGLKLGSVLMIKSETKTFLEIGTRGTKEVIKITTVYFYSHFFQGVAARKTWEVLYIVIRQVPSEQEMERGCLV